MTAPNIKFPIRTFLEVRGLAGRIALAVFFVAGVAAPSIAQTTLSQAVLRAVERDAEVMELRQKVASSNVDILSARDEYFPSISLSGDSATTDSNGPGLTLTVSQVLYDWGLIRNKIEAASQVRVQVVADLKMAVEAATLQISEYFLDVELADQKILRTRNYLEFSRRISGQAEDRAMAGISDNGEVARARLEIARAEDQLSQLLANRQIALSQIEFLVDKSVGRITPAPNLRFSAYYAKAAKIKSAVRIAPDYLAARARIAEAEAGLGTAKASRLPTIKLQAQGRASLNGGKSTKSIGISTGVDLSSSGLGRRKIQVASLNLEAAKTALNSTERELTNVAVSALRQIEILRTSEASRARQLVEAGKVLANYEEQFIAGQRELLDVLTTGRDHYDSQIDEINTFGERKRTEYQAAHDLGVLGTLIIANSAS